MNEVNEISKNVKSYSDFYEFYAKPKRSKKGCINYEMKVLNSRNFKIET